MIDSLPSFWYVGPALFKSLSVDHSITYAETGADPIMLIITDDRSTYLQKQISLIPNVESTASLQLNSNNSRNCWSITGPDCKVTGQC